MEKPAGNWKEMDQFNKFLQKTGGVEFTDNYLMKFLEQNLKAGFGNKRGLTLVRYFYNDDSANNYHPTMSVGVSLIKYIDFEDFTNQVTDIKSNFHNGKVPKSLSFDVPTKSVDISGIRSVYFIYTDSQKDGGKKIKKRAIRYFVPMEDYYFVLAFNDFPGEAECIRVFEQVVNSIKIGN